MMVVPFLTHVLLLICCVCVLSTAVKLSKNTFLLYFIFEGAVYICFLYYRIIFIDVLKVKIVSFFFLLRKINLKRKESINMSKQMFATLSECDGVN